MKNLLLSVSIVLCSSFLHAETNQFFSSDELRLKSTFVGENLENAIGVSVRFDLSGVADKPNTNDFLLNSFFTDDGTNGKNVAFAPDLSSANIICSIISKHYLGAKCDLEPDSLVTTRSEKALIELPLHQVKSQRASGIRLNAMLAAPNMVSIKVGSQLSKDVRVIAIKNDLIILGSSNGDYQIVSFARGNRSGLFKQGL